MAQDIKTLIEKIQQDGIQAADDKAKDIITEARKQADEILLKTKREAVNLIAEAKSTISQMENKQKALLIQAGRDMLLVLRQEIITMCQKLIQARAKDTLTPEFMAKIISLVGKTQMSSKELEVSLSQEDLSLMQEGILNRMKDELKKNIVLKSSEDIQGGFVVSFDSGKSEFDFTDKALADYIGAYLKPKLVELLKEAVKK